MVIYYGNDLVQANEALANLKNPIIIEFNKDDSNLSIFDQLNQTSIFNVSSDVIIHNAVFLTTKGDKYNDLINKLINNDEYNINCIIKCDKLDKFNPLLKKSKKVKFIKLVAINQFNKEQKIKELLSKMNIVCDSYETTNKLISSLPSNLLLVKSELTKLRIYKPNGVITLDDINNILIDNIDTNIFELVNLLLTKDTNKCINLYNKLIDQKHQPVEIISIMASQVFKVKLLKLALIQHTPINQIIEELGISAFQIKQLSFINSLSIQLINDLLNRLFDIDIHIKKGLVDPNQALNLLLACFNLHI